MHVFMIQNCVCNLFVHIKCSLPYVKWQKLNLNLFITALFVTVLYISGLILLNFLHIDDAAKYEGYSRINDSDSNVPQNKFKVVGWE